MAIVSRVEALTLVSSLVFVSQVACDLALATSSSRCTAVTLLHLALLCLICLVCLAPFSHMAIVLDRSSIRCAIAIRAITCLDFVSCLHIHPLPLTLDGWFGHALFLVLCRCCFGCVLCVAIESLGWCVYY